MLQPSEKLLRRLLGLPLVWKLAHAYILENYDCVEGVTCLRCLARTKLLSFKHVLTYDAKRRAFCDKCGILTSEWNRRPKCRGRKDYTPPNPPPQSPIVVVPINWE